MLFDLSFLDVGKTFPPYSELERLEMYRQNKLLFDHRLQEVFAAYLERIIRSTWIILSYSPSRRRI